MFLKGEPFQLRVLCGLAGRSTWNSKKCVAFLLESSPGNFWHLGLRVDGGKVINFLAGCWWPSLTPQDLRQLRARKSFVLELYQFRANYTPSLASLPLASVPGPNLHMSAGVRGPFYLYYVCLCVFVCELASCIKYIIEGGNFRKTLVFRKNFFFF